MKIYRYLLLLGLGLLGQSCQNVLDQQPLDKIAGSAVWNSESLTNAYVVDLYTRFPFYAFDISNWYNLTDEGTLSTGNSNSTTNGTVSRSSEANAYWDYNYIRDCHVFLENIGTAAMSDAVKKQLEGEVRFMLANSYFEMMKRYGGVPLVDKVIDPYSPVDKKFTTRASEEAVAMYIESELDKAIALLGESPLPRGRINKWTAYTLKASAMLWAASIAKYGTLASNGLTGIPASRAKDYYSKASAAADAVIKSGKYSLFNGVPADKSENYRQIFLTENNGEVIFEKAYDGINLGHGWDLWHSPVQFSAGRGGTGDPTLNFVLGYENADGSTDQPVFDTSYPLYKDGAEPFKKKDPRLFATVFFQGDRWAGGTVKTYEGLDPSTKPTPSAIIKNANTVYEGTPAVGPDSRNITKDDLSTNSGFLIKKYLDDKAPLTPDGQSKANWIVYRYAEVLLIKAEAEFELGNLAVAATTLNLTRQRAGISLMTESTITLDKVRTERRSEFAFEGGHRYWDLRRWRTARAVLNTRTQGLQIILHFPTKQYYFIPFNAEAFTRVYREEHYYNPITTNRINNNGDLVENPIY